MSSTKRQHYVPQFYLEKFVEDAAANTPGFWVYDKAGGDPRWQTPVNTAIEGHLYSLDFPDGQPRDLLERQLAGIEGIAKPILARWVGPGARPTREEIAEIAAFLAAMHVRVPRNIAAIGELMAEFYRSSIRRHGDDEAQFQELWDATFGSNPEAACGVTPQEMREYMLNPDHFATITTQRHVAMAFSMLQADEAASALRGYNWCLCLAPEGKFFVTSDCPVNVFRMAEPGQAQFGAGLLLPGTQISFPISPSVCISLDRAHTQRRRRVTDRFVEQRNRRTACMAERFVISPHRTRGIERIVTEFAYTRNQPKLDRTELQKDIDSFAETGFTRAVPMRGVAPRRS